MKFIPFEIKTGKENMQIDSDLLDFAINTQSKEPIFRLYGWSPACVSLGRNQREDFIHKEILNKYNIDIVRRLTGGRALLHDNEITYSCIYPVKSIENGENITESYKKISEILIKSLAELGIELDFGGIKKYKGHVDYCMLISTGADLCYKDKKLIGSAQFRKNGYILQHGSILYDYDKELLEAVFQEDVDTSSITCVKEINPEITKNDIINCFIKYCKQN